MKSFSKLLVGITLCLLLSGEGNTMSPDRKAVAVDNVDQGRAPAGRAAELARLLFDNLKKRRDEDEFEGFLQQAEDEGICVEVLSASDKKEFIQGFFDLKTVYKDVPLFHLVVAKGDLVKVKIFLKFLKRESRDFRNEMLRSMDCFGTAILSLAVEVFIRHIGISEQSCLEIVRCLAAAADDLTQDNFKKKLAKHVALLETESTLEIVRCLIAAGADPKQGNFEEKLAKYVALLETGATIEQFTALTKKY